MTASGRRPGESRPEGARPQSWRQPTAGEQHFDQECDERAHCEKQRQKERAGLGPGRPIEHPLTGPGDNPGDRPPASPGWRGRAEDNAMAAPYATPVREGDLALVRVLEACIETLRAENEILRRRLATAEARAARETAQPVSHRPIQPDEPFALRYDCNATHRHRNPSVAPRRYVPCRPEGMRNFRPLGRRNSGHDSHAKRQIYSWRRADNGRGLAYVFRRNLACASHGDLVVLLEIQPLSAASRKITLLNDSPGPRSERSRSIMLGSSQAIGARAVLNRAA